MYVHTSNPKINVMFVLQFDSQESGLSLIHLSSISML